MVMAAAAVVGGDPGDVRCGGFPAWPFPLDATGAGVARSLVEAVFKALGMPAEMTYDVAVAMSELAANVYLHALRGPVSVDSRVSDAPEISTVQPRPWCPTITDCTWRPNLIFSVRGCPDGRARRN
jgi:hypothetical protein